MSWYMACYFMFTNLVFPLAAWCCLSCYCKAEEGKRRGKGIIGAGGKTNTNVGCGPRYSQCCCSKQWETRFLIFAQQRSFLLMCRMLFMLQLSLQLLRRLRWVPMGKGFGKESRAILLINLPNVMRSFHNKGKSDR